MEIIDDTTETNLLSVTQLQKQHHSNVSSTRTVGSAPTNKRTISSGKNNRSSKRTRTTKLSQTLVQASTSSARDCYGWWTTSCEELSRKLWFPIEIASADLPSNSLSTYVEEVVPVSWSKIKKYVRQNTSSQKILWPLYMSSLAGTTGCAATSTSTEQNKKRKTPKSKKPPKPKSAKSKTIAQTKAKSKSSSKSKNLVTLCQRIRLFPTPDQARILRKWMKGARDTYNRALRLVKDGKAKPTKLLKKLVVTERDEDSDKIKKMKETPSIIRSRAVLDLVDAFKTAHAGYKARLVRIKTSKSRWKVKKKKDELTGRRRWKKRPVFNITYKSRRFTSDSFGFEPSNVKVNNKQLFLFSRLNKYGMKNSGIKMSEELKAPVKMCPRVQYLHGRWYFLCPYKVERSTEAPKEDAVFLDPGVRTFQSYYSENEAGQIGYEMNKTLDQAIKKIKSIKKRIDWATDRKKVQRLRHAWYRAKARASNLVDDLHWKTIKFLLDNFDFVLAPRLNVPSLQRSKTLPIVVKERMTALHHGLFTSRLKFKAKVRGKTVETEFEEHGTSKTCSHHCGQANRRLGTSEVFWCDYCGFRGHRDINSGKDHCLKRLVGKQDY
jgi:putative transposase